jgi:hypothetical protein
MKFLKPLSCILIAFLTASAPPEKLVAQDRVQDNSGRTVRFGDVGVEITFPAPVKAEKSRAQLQIGTYLFSIDFLTGAKYKTAEDFYQFCSNHAKSSTENSFDENLRWLGERRLMMGEHPAYEYHTFSDGEYASAYHVVREVLLGDRVVYLYYSSSGRSGTVSTQDTHGQQFFNTLKIDSNAVPHKMRSAASTAFEIANPKTDKPDNGG